MADINQLPKKSLQHKRVIRHITNDKDRKRKFIFPLLIFIFCFLLYGNTINNNYVLDDGIYTNKNDFIIKGFSAFKDIFNKGSLYGFDKRTDTQYRPLPLLNFMAETSIFGLNPHVSHFFNILFYAFTVVLLYFFLQKILSRRAPPGKNYNQSIIVASTLLFAFHPIHTEVVANIKSRDEILGFFFGLISFYYLIVYSEKNKINYYFYSLLTFSAATFCKENCLTFVLIIPLLLHFFTSLGIKKIVLKSLPYIGLVCFYLFIRNLVMQKMTFSYQIPVMDNVLMAASNNADRTATNFVLLGKYIYMTIIPYPLSWDYSYNQIPIVSWGNIKPIVSLIVCLALLGYGFLTLKRKSIYSFLIAFFFITLFLSSNLIVKIDATFGERFLYAPSLSFCIALPLLLSKAMKFNSVQLKWKNTTNFYIPVVCLLVIYTCIVIPRNNDWKSNYSLFSAGVITSPNSARVHLSLAQEYGEELNQSATKEEKQRLINMDIQETYRALSIYNKYPEAYYNLCTVYLREGMRDSAQIMCVKTLAVKPNHTAAANNLGLIYAQEADYADALKWLNVALKSDSNFINGLINLGTLYRKMGELDKATYYYNRVLKINPDDSDTKNDLFTMYYNSGKDYFNRNDYNRAFSQFMLADKYNSHSAEVTGYLGAIYQSGGNFAKAEEFYRKSLAINPTNVSVQQNLETVIEMQKKK